MPAATRIGRVQANAREGTLPAATGNAIQSKEIVQSHQRNID